MSDASISLPPDIHGFIQERVAEGGYSDASEYVVKLVEGERKKLARGSGSETSRAAGRADR